MTVRGETRWPPAGKNSWPLTLFSAPALLIVWAAIYGFGWSASYDRWLTPAPKTIKRAGDFFPIVVAYSATLLISLVLAGLAFKLFARKIWKTSQLLGHSGWTQAFYHEGQGNVSFANIRLTDGSIIRGFVNTFSTEHAFDEREIVLEGRILALDPNGKPLWEPDLAPSRVVLAHTQIRYLGVNLVPAVVAQPKTRSHQRHEACSQFRQRTTHH